jgi:hypothetical protein
MEALRACTDINSPRQLVDDQPGLGLAKLASFIAFDAIFAPDTVIICS